MLRHVVLIRFRAETTGDQKQAVLDALGALPAQVPQIRGYVFGLDAGISEGNYDLAVVADFDDAEGYREYATNAEHQRVIRELIAPILAERAAVQYVNG